MGPSARREALARTLGPGKRNEGKPDNPVTRQKWKQIVTDNKVIRVYR